jgi:ATP-dependent DNA ligase
MAMPSSARPCSARKSASRGCLYEPKYDGYRALAHIHSDGGVQLSSRHGARLNEMFPEVVMAIWEHLPKRTIVDFAERPWCQHRADLAIHVSDMCVR